MQATCPHVHPCSHLYCSGGCSTGWFMPRHRCPGTRHVLMADVTSAAPRPGHPVPPSSKARSTLAPRAGLRQQGHPTAHPQPLTHGSGTTQSCTVLPENSSPAPNPHTLSLPASPQGRKGTHRAEEPGCRCPTPCAAAGSGEGAWPVSQHSAGVARALCLLLAQLLHVH